MFPNSLRLLDFLYNGLLNNFSHFSWKMPLSSPHSIFSSADRLWSSERYSLLRASVQGHPGLIWTWPGLTQPHLSMLAASCVHSSFSVRIHSIHFSFILCYLGWVARSSDGGVEDLVILIIDDLHWRQVERPVPGDSLIFLIKSFLTLLMALSRLICCDLSKINSCFVSNMLLLNMVWFDYQSDERIIFYEKMWLSFFLN